MANANLQSVLDALVRSSREPPRNKHSGASSTADDGSVPLDASALTSSLLSMTAMAQWLKFLILGAIFETCRRSLVRLYKFALDHLFITIDIAETDPCYNWIMVWLVNQPSWNNARNIELRSESTGPSGVQIAFMHGVGQTSMMVPVGGRKLTYKPSHSSSHSLWFERRWLRINRWEKEGTHSYKQKEEFLRLRLLSRNHRVLNKLLDEAEAAYKGAQENTTAIYVSDSQRKRWRHLANRRKRPLNSIVLDPGIKDKLVSDAREFLASQDWYAARGIPFRRGYLLHGEPGSGKTSMIQCLAGELGLDIYIISLSRAGLDDNELNELISRLPEKCIALMEDIDAAFVSTTNRESSDALQDESSDNPQTQKYASKVTLSGLLNALDGVAAQEGRLLFATTNKYRSLDPALIRPGRMDVHVEFGLASKQQARELYQRFYAPDDEISDEPTSSITEDGEAELSEKDSMLIELDDSPPRTVNDVLIASSEPSSFQAQTVSPSVEVHQVKPHLTFIASDSGKTPVLSKAQLGRLAIMFSNTLPEREFSMAALQGYLMRYKTEPVEAVREFMTWIEQERREKKDRKRRLEKEITVGLAEADSTRQHNSVNSARAESTQAVSSQLAM